MEFLRRPYFIPFTTKQFTSGFEKCHQGALSRSKFSRSISVVNDLSESAQIYDGR